MIKKLKYLFILLFAFILFPKDTYAANITGSFVLYPGLGNNTLQPAYDNNYGSTHTITGSLPGNYVLIPGYSNGYYTFIKRMYLEIYTDNNFDPGTTYELTFNYESGSYVRYSNYYNWNTLNTLFNVNMKDQGGNDLNPLGQFSRTENSGYFKVTFVPQVSSNALSINFTCINDPKSFLFWNSFDQMQGFKFSSISVSSTSGGGSSTDMTETNEKLDSIGDDLATINDNLTDDSSVSTNDLEDFFGDIPVISSGPISDLLLLPPFILNGIINNVNTSTCQNISIPWFYNQRLNFPCWNLDTYIDEDYWGWIELVLYVFMFYNIGMLVVSCWETWTNLSTDFDSLYTPKHYNLEYKPKHGGGN